MTENNVIKRLQKELMDIMISNDENITAFPMNDNIFTWKGNIKGPNGTYYENLKYDLYIKFPSDYPHNPPFIKFIDKCFHPNIDYKNGNICIDILKDKWSPAFSISTVLISICSLLNEPNNNDPLNNEAADIWHNKSEFMKFLKN